MKKIDRATVESEIRKEKAEALGRAGELLERALRELQAMRQEILGLLVIAERSFRDGEARGPAEVEQKFSEYARLREHAAALRQALIIQREAVGPWRHENVDRQYPLPGPLPLPMVTPSNG